MPDQGPAGGAPPSDGPVRADAVQLATMHRLCASHELLDKGRAIVFDVLHHGEPLRAFALRFDGVVVAYLNRCAHVAMELDWQPGEFLDGEGEVIVCAIHGAAYEPASGRCVGGPCGRGRLHPLDVVEALGEVAWRPDRDTVPAPAAMTLPP